MTKRSVLWRLVGWPCMVESPSVSDCAQTLVLLVLSDEYYSLVQGMKAEELEAHLNRVLDDEASLYDMGRLFFVSFFKETGPKAVDEVEGYKVIRLRPKEIPDYAEILGNDRHPEHQSYLVYFAGSSLPLTVKGLSRVAMMLRQIPWKGAKNYGWREILGLLEKWDGSKNENEAEKSIKNILERFPVVVDLVKGKGDSLCMSRKRIRPPTSLNSEESVNYADWEDVPSPSRTHNNGKGSDEALRLLTEAKNGMMSLQDKVSTLESALTEMRKTVAEDMEKLEQRNQELELKLDGNSELDDARQEIHQLTYALNRMNEDNKRLKLELEESEKEKKKLASSLEMERQASNLLKYDSLQRKKAEEKVRKLKKELKEVTKT